MDLPRRQLAASRCQRRRDCDGHMRAIEVAPVRAAMVAARRRESLYVRAMCSVLASASVAASTCSSRQRFTESRGGPRQTAFAERRVARFHGRGIAPHGRWRRPRSWGPANPRRAFSWPGPGASHAVLGGKSRVWASFAPGGDRTPDPAGRAISPRISTGDGDVAIVLAARCGEHGAGRRRENRDRSHGVCDTICLHDLR